MKSKDVNLRQLGTIASALGDLVSQVTFVGGCTTVLLVDEAAHFGVRKTDDVDVIIDAVTLHEYHNFSKELRQLGFREDTKGPVCRWLFDAEFGTLKLDVMPVDEKVLGFSNRWYPAVMDTADEISLPSGETIRVINAAYFIATKFEAYLGRGQGDHFSHDLEDIVFVLENRHHIIVELMNCTQGLKQYFARQAGKLLTDDFLNVLPGLLNNPDSAVGVENSLKIMEAWTEN